MSNIEKTVEDLKSTVEKIQKEIEWIKSIVTPYYPLCHKSEDSSHFTYSLSEKKNE